MRRAIRAEPSTRPLFLLLTDGEEIAQQGAKEFVRAHPLASRKPFVINLDAHGNRGPAIVYETHDNNLATIASIGNRLPSPRIVGSHFMRIAKAAPNRTDFRIFCRAGWPGVNIALIDGVEYYHSPDDTINALDRAAFSIWVKQLYGSFVRSMTLTMAPFRQQAERCFSTWLDCGSRRSRHRGLCPPVLSSPRW